MARKRRSLEDAKVATIIRRLWEYGGSIERHPGTVHLLLDELKRTYAPEFGGTFEEFISRSVAARAPSPLSDVELSGAVDRFFEVFLEIVGGFEEPPTTNSELRKLATPLLRGLERSKRSAPTGDKGSARQESSRVLPTSGGGKLQVSVALPEDADVETVANLLAQLYVHLSGYHVAAGGSGLEVESWDVFQPENAPAGALS